MKAKDIAKKLEGYEQRAYEGGYGLDWLANVGENVKFYMNYCDENKVKPTIESLTSWIDKMHEEAES